VLVLRKPRKDDVDVIVGCYKRSAEIYKPWRCPPTDVAAYLAEEHRYFLCKEHSGDIVGTFNISGVVRGYFQSGYLGYEIFSPHQNRGYMSIGIRLVVNEAFNHLNLHRLEANIQPGNDNSIKLVSGAGFVKEGYSKNYLNIGGHGWKDHERWAIVNNIWSSAHT